MPTVALRHGLKLLIAISLDNTGLIRLDTARSGSSSNDPSIGWPNAFELAFDTPHALDLFRETNSRRALFRGRHGASQRGDAILIGDADSVITQLAALFDVIGDSLGRRSIGGRLRRPRVAWHERNRQ
jgi:hypothetical protein